MKNTSIRSLAFVFVPALLLAGCAVTPLSQSGAKVREISESQAANCHFIQSISTNNHNTLSQNPAQDARNQAMNQVAELGGNALLIKTTHMQESSSGVGGVFSLSGAAYRCP